MVKVAIIGATGYGGVELIRLLSAHPGVELTYLSSETFAGKKVREVYPHFSGLLGLAETEYRELDVEAVSRECEYALLALPAGESLGIVPKLLEAGLKVIDVSPDFRLKDEADYNHWYKSEHTKPEFLGEAAFGIPEWHRDKIASARLTAAPGCYSTAVLLALLPLAREGLIDCSDIIADGKSGISGAGRTSLSLPYHYPEANEDFSAYSVGGHRHLPEMIQELSAVAAGAVSITFTPHLAPMTRGILMTCYAKPAPDVDENALRASLQARYSAEPFVYILPEGRWPHTKWTAGTNLCFIAVGTDKNSGRAVIISALDNLGKGMSGQMVQCLNLMMGVEETTALGGWGVYP